MVQQYKIGIIGYPDAILPFRMVGFDLFPARTGEEAQNHVRQLAEEDFGIIYITEDLASEIPETIRVYDNRVTPAIILLPTHKDHLGIGIQRIQDNVEKAVGTNIL